MGNIKIYSKLKSGKVSFEGSRVRDKDIGTLTVNAHPNAALSNRIQIKSNKVFKRNSSVNYRVFFRKKTRALVRLEFNTQEYRILVRWR